MSDVRKCTVSKEEVGRLYTEGLLTMAEIGQIVGIGKQGVSYILNRLGIKYQGGVVKRYCLYCEKTFEVSRKVIKNGAGRYCSVTCFHAARVINPDRYLLISEADKRMGNKTARRIMGVKLNDLRVVHHKDGDPTNNDINNLQVYPSQSEHMAEHHKHRR